QLGRRAVRARGAVQQPLLALLAPALEPPVGGALADAGGLGRPRQRPRPTLDPCDKQPAALRTGASVSVKLHPVSSLGLSWLGSSQPPRSPGCLTDQRA